VLGVKGFLWFAFVASFGFVASVGIFVSDTTRLRAAQFTLGKDSWLRLQTSGRSSHRDSLPLRQAKSSASSLGFSGASGCLGFGCRCCLAFVAI
jgi:hypothetical protein